MLNYFYDCYTVLNKVYSEKAFIKQALNETEIELKNRAVVTKICYGVLDKDIELSFYIKSLTTKSPKLVIRTILKISIYAIKYLEKKEYAVTENAVELTKKLGKKGASGFVNAFLRKFINYKFVFPSDEAEHLSIKYSYPIFAVNELINDYGKNTAEKIMNSQNLKTCLAFYGISGKSFLDSSKIEYELTPYDNVFLLNHFNRDENYDKGIYTYQALGSVAICDMISHCESLYDCCAAPGGKSIRLSYKCKNIFSSDIYTHRVKLIDEYIKRMKRENIKTFVYDSTVYNEEFEKKFDAVLCDSPCSGFGVVNDNPDIKINKDFHNLAELTNIQYNILQNVKNYVKLNGYLYYSTCSIFKKENIEIVNKFLENNKNYILEKVDCKLNCLNLNGTIQLLPDISNGLGFFFAKLKRIN